MSNVKKNDSRTRLSDLEVHSILDEHEKWLDPKERGGVRARFVGVRLSGSIVHTRKLNSVIFYRCEIEDLDFSNLDLSGAIFHKSNIEGVNFSDSNLQHAIFRNTVISNANFLRSDLRDSKLENCSIKGVTRFQDSSLQNSDWSEGVKGSLASQFSGANLAGAKLPVDTGYSGVLEHTAEISKHARGVFLGILGACVFSWLTIATSTDVSLLSNAVSTALPVIQTKIPIAGFYGVAPVVLLGLYIYLHLYLQRLWDALSDMPSVFPDGRPLDRRAYPWLLTGLVRPYFHHLSSRQVAFSNVQVGISIVTAWCIVPLTLIVFWLRYISRHEWVITYFHVFLISVCSVLGVIFFFRAKATLIRERPLESRWYRTLMSLLPYTLCALCFIVSLLLLYVSQGAISGEIKFRVNFLGYRSYANIAEQNITEKPKDWTEINDRREKIENIEGPNLHKANLRYLRAMESFLVGANLSYADLYRARFNGAYMSGTNLEGANLEKANFRHADLRYSDLRGVNLLDTNLEGANLDMADLSAVKLGTITLSSVSLKMTNLDGADLRRVRNISFNQLKAACGQPILPEEFRDLVLTKCVK